MAVTRGALRSSGATTWVRPPKPTFRVTLVSAARTAILNVTKEEPRLNYAYALSDTRYPLVDWKAQAIGIGPVCGDLGTKDEWIDREQYLDTIAVVADLLHRLLSTDSPSPP